MKTSDITHTLGEAMIAFLARLLIVPLTIVVPRNIKLCVVIGRENGKFLDNAKHYFCWLHENQPCGHQSAFITEHADTKRLLRRHGAKAYRYPFPGALWTLLRAGTIVVDSVDQLEHGRVAFLYKARFVQLWHGAPIKEIELPLHARRLANLTPPKRIVLRALKVITGRYRNCDILVSTSEYFSRHAFNRCFSARKIITTGYPRNDVILEKIKAITGLRSINVDLNALAQIRAARAGGLKVVLYAPTFRMSRESPFESGKADLKQWAVLASQNNYLLVLKLHPVMARNDLHEALGSVVDVSTTSDIYPLLAEMDLLVTDYSSIYFDYLLLNRPIVFFPYDYEYYTRQDRHILFDYDAMTPGPKAYDFHELLDTIPKYLGGNDKFQVERERIRSLAFDQYDGSASERIWHALNA